MTDLGQRGGYAGKRTGSVWFLKNKISQPVMQICRNKNIFSCQRRIFGCGGGTQSIHLKKLQTLDSRLNSFF